MSQFTTEFNSTARFIREALYHPSVALLRDPILQVRAEVLRSIFPQEGDLGGYSSFLDLWFASAPGVFVSEWPKTRKSLETAIPGGTLEQAIQLLARLLGWAFISAFLRDEQIELTPIYRLAALQLGLTGELSQRDLMQALFTYKQIMWPSITDHLDKAIVGGTETITALLEKVEEKQGVFETILKPIESRVETAESRIKDYQDSLDRFRASFGFLGLTQAFREFFNRKTREFRSVTLGLVLSGLAVIVFPIGSLTISLWEDWAQATGADAKRSESVPAAAKSNAPDDGAKRNDENTKQLSSSDSVARLESNLPRYLTYAAIEIILLYFFRVLLMQFNSVRAQLLQLELRIAVCRFVEDYAKFAKDNESKDLGKFEALIFGGITASEERIPSTFDGLEQLVSAIRTISTGK